MSLWPKAEGGTALVCMLNSEWLDRKTKVTFVHYPSRGGCSLQHGEDAEDAEDEPFWRAQQTTTGKWIKYVKAVSNPKDKSITVKTQQADNLGTIFY